MKPRGRLWWYLRMRRAYRKHGVTIKEPSETWAEAMFARKMMPPDEQRNLHPLSEEAPE